MLLVLVAIMKVIILVLTRLVVLVWLAREETLLKNCFLSLFSGNFFTLQIIVVFSSHILVLTL